MENSPKFLDPQTLAKLKGLRLRARHIVEGYVAGLHRSPYRGFSIEFAEHRDYVPGDDLRYVDWKLFGRTDKYYVKQYEDETNLICYIILDVSESMLYQSDSEGLSKFEYAQALAASLAWLVLKQQDSVGLVAFDDRIRHQLPASSNASHLEQVFDLLDASPGRAKTNVGPIFHQLGQSFARRGVVVILSDLFDDFEHVVSGLKRFRHRRHEVMVCHLLDPAEIEFPFDRPTLFKGLEGISPVLADPRALGSAYRREFDDFRRRLELSCRQNGLSYRLVKTNQPVDLMLRSLLSVRD